jgi:threonine/homoserine/homoserine lactone efflux protein
VNIASLTAFWAVAALLIIVPGADWAFVIGAAAGSRSVLPAVGGLVLGYTGITAVVAAGVGAAVAGSPTVLTGLTLVGGAYLVWHGTATFAHPAMPPSMADGVEPVPGADRRTLIRGIGVSGLNPKGVLILLALLPQFTRPGEPWPVAAQIGVLGLVFTLSCAAFYLALGTFARTVLNGRPRFAQRVSRVAGGAMVVIGLLLVFERIFA